MSAMIPVEEIVYRPDLYPRQGVSSYRVASIADAMEAGVVMPPIILAEGTMVLVDGMHRWRAAEKLRQETILADVRPYESEADLFRDASLLNTGHGSNLTTYDRLRVIEISLRLGISEEDQAGMLQVSVSRLRAIQPRFASVADAVAGETGLRAVPARIPLKASVRHMSGHVITQAQADAISAVAPGSSYLLIIRQLASAVEHGLLPPEDQHPVLWAELRRLGELLP